MPLDSGYVLIQPCVACWREPTAMSRLLRVSWLSAGRHSILELATGEETGEMASQRARHPGTLADRCRRSFPQQAVLPECHPQWPWGTCPPAVLLHRGPRADVRPPAPPRGSQEPPGHSLWVLSPVLADGPPAWVCCRDPGALAVAGKGLTAGTLPRHLC